MRKLKNAQWISLISILLLVFSAISCRNSAPDEPDFSFAFLTDIHVQPEQNATEGFLKAIEMVNELRPDFVITGGDLIMDALGVGFERADSLYNLYAETVRGLQMPVHNTVGNHEVFGYFEESGVDSSHPMYGDKLYEERLGKRYYAFDYKGWRFYIFDSIDELEEGGYYGHIDREQISWLRKDLEGVDRATPIAISVHIPIITVQTQIHQGSTVPNDSGAVITNSKELLDLFNGYNLKLVLQGHLHAYEDIYVNGIRFITGGAVSGRWWNGPRFGMEEGFLMVHISGDEFTSEYIDYGWHVEE
jgi:3',5'-cyclic AMP phosphodiesterase CpdA